MSGPRFSKLYPIRGVDTTQLDTSPMVGVALIRLARHVILPFEDAVTFKDVLDRCVDQDLRLIFQTMGGASEVWAQQLEAVLLGQEVDPHPTVVRTINLAVAFLAEAFLDIVKLQSYRHVLCWHW